MEEAKKLIARTQGEVASYEAAIQFPVFRNELKQIKTMQQQCLQSPELTVTQKLAKLEALALEVGSIQENFQKVPITESMPEYKELQSLIKEAAKLERVLQKAIEVDVSGLNFVTRFLVKAKRSINVMQQLGGALNAQTIIKGASKNWDPERLRTGKHEVLRAAGAEHVQLTSSTGCKVDAHYLSAATFMAQLEKLGGERKIFRFGLEQTELLNGQEYVCEIEGEPVSVREIELPGQEDDLKTIELIFGTLMAMGHRIDIIEGEVNRFFIIDLKDREKLINTGILHNDKLINLDILEPVEKREPFVSSTEFSGIKFQKNSSQWREAVQLLENMNLRQSSWDLFHTEDAVYLIPKESIEKFDMAMGGKKAKSTLVNFEEVTATKATESNERGTVLLTMHQMAIYEQYTEEMLTFALQGVNVMMYNNPGKGLSTGNPDRKNIDASIEAAYQYLKKDKDLPDHKLLAKGQCFGGPPTAWLGQEHPNINVMLDQNPANFHEVVGEQVYSELKNVVSKKGEFAQWLEKKITDNFIVDGVAKAIFGGYNVSSDLSKNQGSKLIHINVAREGIGGDDLVPSHHPIEMIDAIGSQDKVVTLSMNPGGTHVTHWWLSAESQETVNRFLERTGISQPLF